MADSKENLAKSFNMMENSIDKMWDMWMAGLGSISWAQEQMENMTRKQLDQNKTAREEMIKLVEDMATQTRKNQEQFQKMVEEAVIDTYDQINVANHKMMQDLTRRVDELSKKVDNR
ncbi:MAG: phasin family protein [Syntrophomonadaceae bacterium]|nr:phasin family protein [Syntrophomonadaceae bacterium]